jgi:hypothetical protein
MKDDQMRLRVVESNSHLTTDYIQTFAVGNVFIETGTYHGDTIKLALKNGFQKVYSVELNQELFDAACEMFRGDERVHLVYGESPEGIESILSDLNEEATFWLDAHASGPLAGGKSGGTPILDELRMIEKHHIKSHTIMIDDRRLFGSAEWSGVKESEAMELLMKINPDYKIYYLDAEQTGDIICATTKGP